MALPIRPAGGLPTNRPQPVNDEHSASLPEVRLPELPEIPEPPRNKEPEPGQRPRAEKPAEAVDHFDEESWAIDTLTGKRYKRIAGYKPGVMKSKAAVAKASNGGMSLEQLRATVNDEPDFNLDDLNSSAELFLPHLRVPPDKEEQKRLLAERAEREKRFAAAAARAAEEDEEDESF